MLAFDITAQLSITVYYYGMQEEQKKGMAMLCMTRACSDLLIETQSDWGYSLGECDQS